MDVSQYPKNETLIYYSSSGSELQKVSSHVFSKLIELNDFLLDMTKHLLKSASPEPVESLKSKISEYVSCSMNGDFVLLKSYQTISGTYFNRVCFIAHFANLFRLRSPESDSKFNGFDYLQLLRLICADFPDEITEKAILIILRERPSEDRKFLQFFLPGRVFIKALFLVAVYREFCEETARILNASDSVQNYAANILSFAETLREKSLYEGFYMPPLGMIYSRLLKYVKDAEFREKVLVFSKKNMGNLKSKGFVTTEWILNDIVNDKGFERKVIEEIGLFDRGAGNEKLERMEKILRGSQERSDNGEDSAEEI